MRQYHQRVAGSSSGIHAKNVQCAACMTVKFSAVTVKSDDGNDVSGAGGLRPCSCSSSKC